MPNGISIEMAVLIVVGVLAAITISSAILEHAQVLWDVHQLRSTPLPVTDATWHIVAAQLAVDGLKEPVDICSFSSMQVLSQPRLIAWIRFVLRDGRVLVFATAQAVPGCKGRGYRIDTHNHPQAAYEIQQLWMYFMLASGQAAPIPRDANWYVLPLQTPQDRLGRAVVLRNHQSYRPNLLQRLHGLLLTSRR